MSFFLVGYMGSGKSTLGKKVSEILNLSFLDLDDLIEKDVDMSIHDIFNKKGEVFFRKKEREVLLNYDFASNAIIATGGGTPCFYNNHNFIKSIGTMIYLKVSPNEIVKRLQFDNKRPLLFNNKLNLYKFVNQQLSSRECYYSMSDYILESDNILIDELLAIINNT